ncbi:hypothetical protein M407DRAFT_91464 [Tulasnella calospora MUT 4182]|uniref:MARVEL domain-containing protein n=1 Tax=Tulasnella calospora MUT 4182 TaxID=1051891 RepID=A0A0C3QUH1_9AGAM|nr:hypothetical protein M407DRAFT_91464 [Tulasnella calospora MUT 4182]
MIVDLVRRGRGVTSMVWFDLARTFALWALWIATAVSITTVEVDSCLNKKTGYFTKSTYDSSNTDGSICLLFRIAQVSTWIVAFLTFTWFIILLCASNVAVARGYSNVWTSPLQTHPVGLGKQRNSSASSEDASGYMTGSNEKFVPSAYGLLVSSYEHRASSIPKDGYGRPPRRDRGEEGPASTSTLTVQTVHLDPPPPAVVVSTAPAIVDLEAQQPQPRRID